MLERSNVADTLLFFSVSRDAAAWSGVSRSLAKWLTLAHASSPCLCRMLYYHVLFILLRALLVYFSGFLLKIVFDH